MPGTGLITQVLVPGHTLDEKTKAFLVARYGRVRIYNELLHFARFDRVDQDVIAYFQRLAAKGFDTSGRATTVFCLAGSSIGTAMLVAAWVGITGQVPNILNLIQRRQRDASTYEPSPELPVINGQDFRHRIRAAMRAELNQVEEVG